MGPTEPAQSSLFFLSLLGLLVSAAVYGRVRTELIVALALATFFGVLVALSAARPSRTQELTVNGVLASAATLAAIVFALGGFLAFRRLGLRETFGLTRVPAARVLGQAALLLLAAFPLVALAGVAAQHWMNDAASEQELVQLFRQAAGRHDVPLMLAVFFTGVIVAPICEELLFRGYFYGVGKRFLGPKTSAVITSLLFAAFHGNLTALAGLFILALALNLAYERTGSLAVPMTMHALFNGTSLAVLYAQATGFFSP